MTAPAPNLQIDDAWRSNSSDSSRAFVCKHSVYARGSRFMTSFVFNKSKERTKEVQI